MATRKAKTAGKKSAKKASTKKSATAKKPYVPQWSKGAVIGLLACSKKKSDESIAKPTKKIPAQELYRGRTFLQSREYATRYCKDWLILSGKHGLLKKDEPIAHYECYLGDRPASERREWCNCVLAKLKQAGLDLTNDLFIILGGKTYYENLCKHLNYVVFRCYSGGIYLDKAKEKKPNGGK